MIEAWLAAAADDFWDRAGAPPPFPRDLTAVLPVALPVSVALLPALALDRVERWLAQRQAPYRFPCANRRLRGCLIAYEGAGVVFVDGADAVDERRFTLAHEAAHVLLDYLRPRERAIQQLGPAILDVLDSRRPPTAAERIDAILAACPIGVHIHLLDRAGADSGLVALVEERADRLAWELLAPAAAVRQRVGATADAVALTGELTSAFGLPPIEAARYARRLRQEEGAAPSFVDWLRP